MKNLKEVSGQRENSSTPIDNSRTVNPGEHKIKIMMNELVREAAKEGIPIFGLYYSEKEGYVYNGMLPEELGVESEYGKFNEFLRICMGFNKEEFFKTQRVQVEK